MFKCSCYHEETRIRYVDCLLKGAPIELEEKIGVCWGTKEREECSCGGDELKCNFYRRSKD